MGVKRSPRNNNSNSYNNFYDGGLIIQNYVSKTLNPTYIKPISSAKKTFKKSDQGRRSLRPIEKKNEEVIENNSTQKKLRRSKRLIENEKKKLLEETVKSVKSDMKEKEEGNSVLISSVDKFIGNLNVMSCRDIKHYLETTDLSVEDKIVFIKSNSSGYRQLRAYIKSLHLSVKEMTYFFKAGQSFRAILSQKLRKAADFMIPELNEKDPDCIEVNNLLSQYEEEVNKKNDPYNFYKAYYTTRDIVKGSYDWVIKPTYDWILKPGLKGLYYLGAVVAQLFKLGFDIWTWITKDPKTAYFSLLTLKVFRNSCCRYVGRILREGNFIDKKTLEDYKSNSEKSSIWWDITNPLAKELALKVTSKASTGLIDKYGKTLTQGVATTLGLLGPLGKIAGGALSMVMDVALEEAKDALVEATEIAIYQNNVNNAFGMLFEVINPFRCIQIATEEMEQVEREYEENNKKNDALEDIKKKELENSV